MLASGAEFQLVGTFNQWQDGTAIESATEWASASGYGTYLDLLHAAATLPPPPSSRARIGRSGPRWCRRDRILRDDERRGDSRARPPVPRNRLHGRRQRPALRQIAQEYRDCYGPSWGAFRERTRPAAGSRDYFSPGADGYFSYFGAAAGARRPATTPTTSGTWRIYVLNSNCTKIGGCQSGSPQETWLRSDLRAHPSACIGAYWQSPRFSSGRFGDDVRDQAVLAGPVQRTARSSSSPAMTATTSGLSPLTPTGRSIDPVRDPRVHRRHRRRRPYALRGRLDRATRGGTDASFGVLRLTLHPTGYEWQFRLDGQGPVRRRGARELPLIRGHPDDRRAARDGDSGGAGQPPRSWM